MQGQTVSTATPLARLLRAHLGADGREEVPMNGIKPSREQALIQVLASGPDDVTVADIAGSTGLGRSTVGKALAKLERAGKVRRRAGGRDGARRLPDRWSSAAERLTMADTLAPPGDGPASRRVGGRYPRRAMPQRQTKRGAERTPLAGNYDVLICGASFAGLAVARELAGSGARTLIVDRYEIGERQTSACAAPTAWLEAMGVAGSIRQTFDTLVVHTPHTRVDFRLPWTFSTFDYGELCGALFEQCDAEFETAKVHGRATSSALEPSDMPLPAPHGTGPESPGVPGSDEGRRKGDPIAVTTDRGDISAPVVVDALGWKRVLAGNEYQPPEAPLSRGLEVHPQGGGNELEIWIDRDYVPAGYSWSFPARDEVRVGVGSFDPRFHVKEPTVRLADDLDRDAVRYQGNWIPHELRPAIADGVFFVGDSAGHCLPLTAEGIRTAFYFGIACGRELRQVIAGRAEPAIALRRYGDFSATHEWQFRWMLRVQRLVPRVPPRLLAAALRGMERRSFVDWSFGHYLRIADPAFAGGGPAYEPVRELRAA
ncbi:MAG: MarR family transcriptional regulator [Solirubrobacterales bacterium]|nr:MarR family transcriptional regulator [Solirubrobacterales bacterium]